jgi:tetratricopeptide (TPR) repeat protein
MPSPAAGRLDLMFRRRTLLALMILGVVPAFALVNFAVSAARARREAISADWARRGTVDLANGQAAAAAEDYETANQYARDRGAYRLQLAQALVAARRTLEAEAELQTLWNATPGNGTINLQLARLCAIEGREADAVRYYHAAIDGAWDADAAATRRHVRLELARFLLARNERTQAQAELMALAADLPADPTDPAAARLAGEVAFDTGDYRGARRYLELARRDGFDADAARMLDLSTRVGALDPYARGIRSRERVRRVVRAFEIADAALTRCAADPLAPLGEQRDELQPQADESTLARDPDAVDAMLMFASDAVAAVHRVCGEGQGDERALELMFQQRRPQS